MNRDSINKISFITCLTCIGLGASLALASIWGDVGNELFWKISYTTLVLFTFSLLTAIVNRCIPK